MMEVVQKGVEVANESYHRRNGISHSGLKLFREDPRLYHWKYILKNWDDERKGYFDFGSAVHQIALMDNADGIKLIPKNVLSASGSKAGGAWKQFEEENKKCLLLKQDEYDSVWQCVESIRKHPVAGRLLKMSGDAEYMFCHDDDLLGVELKCKPDKLIPTQSGHIIIDIKTTESVSPRSFASAIVNYEYDCQAYFYKRVLAGIAINVIDFVFIAVSKSAPYSVNCFSIDAESMATAEQLTEAALADISERFASNDWEPKNSDQIMKLTLPRYSQYRGDYTL